MADAMSRRRRIASAGTAAGGGCFGAAFRPGDEPTLVRASFACPGCLRAAHAVTVVDARALPVAELSCRGCGRLWQVELTLAQLLRVLVAGVAGIEVVAGPQAARLRELATCDDEDRGA